MIKQAKTLLFSCIYTSSLLISLSAWSADYPPALNYDDYVDSLNMGTTDYNLQFASKILRLGVFVPGRNAQVRTDIVDATGKIIISTEHVQRYKNGQALGDVDTSIHACAKRTCITGPDSVKLKPGLYWMVLSENGKPFSAEWFEVRSYPLGEGRFAKGEISYTYLPQTQMARLSFSSSDEFVAELGFAGEKAVGDKTAISQDITSTIKQNGKLWAKTPGKMPERLTIYPYTRMERISLSKAATNGIIKKADLTDGNYELEVQVDKKAYRKFNFQVKGGKFVYQGRQQENTQPPERMIVSEKSAWLWSSFSKEPARTLPSIDFNSKSGN